MEGEESLQPFPDGQSPLETVQLGDDDGPDHAPSHARCRVGLHHWATHRSEDGRPYRTCTICGKDEYNPPLFMGVDPLHR
jgi:hypothetical protein